MNIQNNECIFSGAVLNKSNLIKLFNENIVLKFEIIW